MASSSATALSGVFSQRMSMKESGVMARYQCPDCSYVYDEEKGEAHEGFPPNTSWAQIPADWACPDCAVRDKPDFIPLGPGGQGPEPSVAGVETEPFAKWHCVTCGHIYDEALGDPDTGVAPGTRWADVPDDWYCPDCGATKEAYEPYG